MAQFFVALDCEDKKTVFEQLQKILPLDAVLTKSFHITLIFLGEIPEHQVPSLVTKLKTIQFQTITANLSSCQVFPNPKHARVAWVGVTPEEQITDIATAIHKVTPEIKLDHKFVPHITLARLHNHPKNIDNFLTQKIPKTQFTWSKAILYQTIFEKAGVGHVAVTQFP